MKTVALSQRVDINPAYGERRDALDQRWYTLLSACGFTGIALPNHAEQTARLLDALTPVGIILTGGNDLADLGGDAPERDQTEQAMLNWAVAHDTPVLGVCRGMQFLLHTFGAGLQRVPDHVGTRHRLDWMGRAIEVNSYHAWSTASAPPDFEITARSADGFVEAVRHRTKPIIGVMWHPERETPFAEHDVALLHSTFGHKK